MTSPLFGEREQQILEFEKLEWKYRGAKEAEIRQRFGLSATHYYQLLNAVIGTEEAIRSAPALVGRLRSRRTTRVRLSTNRYGATESSS